MFQSSFKESPKSDEGFDAGNADSHKGWLVDFMNGHIVDWLVGWQVVGWWMKGVGGGGI